MKTKSIFIILILAMFLVGTACAGNVKTSEDQANEKINNGNFVKEQKEKTKQEKELYKSKVAGSVDDVCADYDSDELTAYKNKDKIHIRSSVHFQRSIRIPWNEITQVDGFKGSGNSGQVLITHVPDIGVPQSWAYSCFNDGGYAYFDDLPFSEIIIGGALGYCEFTSDNVTGNHNIIVNGCVYEGINASVTNWHEIRDTNTALVYSIIPNDFGITIANNFSAPGNYTNVTIAVSEGEYVTDSIGNVLDIVENVSTETGNVSLFSVDGYNNSNIIVRDDYMNNAGDVVVFDTVIPGNTIESTWVKVTRADWEFTGDAVIENGLIRIILKEFPAPYIYDGSVWKRISNRPDISTFPSIVPSTLLINTMLEDTISISFENSNIDSISTFVLNRGNSYYHETLSTPNSTYWYPYYRFLYTSDGALYDAEIATVTFRDPDGVSIKYIASFDPYNTFVAYKTFSKYAEVDSIGNYIRYSRSEESKPSALGAMPISPVYVEAETTTLGGGATNGSAYKAYPITGTNVSFLDAQNEYITNTSTYEETSSYTLFVRVNDTNTVADDIRINIIDETSSQTLSNDTYTSSANWNYISQEFSVIGNHEINVTVSKDTANANNITIDYMLSVPTEKIETSALRSLLNITTTENSFEYVPQNFTVSAGTVTNNTSLAFSDNEILNVDTNESITNISITTESEDYSYNVTTWFTENTTLVDEKLTDEYYQLSIRFIPGDDYLDSIIRYTSDNNAILASDYLTYDFTSTNTNATLAYNTVTRTWTIDGGQLIEGESDVYNIMAYLNTTTVLDVYAGFGDEHVETYPITGNETNAIGSRYVVSSDSELLTALNGSDIWVPVSGIIIVIVVIIFSGMAIRALRRDY